ncbi:hypothetical protein V6R21_30435 [Limibacter armeniacum]|uniref:hypothetical protein n=1 Tax=Limibacter armeniacum TaxID=466084 RepID=UPI002FE5957B
MKKLTFLLIPWLLLISCNTDNLEPGELPEVTTEGKGTFACTINGQSWEPCCTAFFQVDRNAYLTDKFVGIVGQKQKSADEVLAFQLLRSEINIGEEVTYLKSNGKLGIWSENKNEGNSAHYYYNHEDSIAANGGEKTHALLYRDAFRLTVKILRMDEEVVAGTFSFDALTHTGDTLHVRDGRFDLRVE